MKKIWCLFSVFICLLVCLLLWQAIAQKDNITEDDNVAIDEGYCWGSYNDVINSATEDMAEVGNCADGYGLFYDIDENGIDELILMHNANAENESVEFPYMVCSVFTMRNGKIVTLLYQQKMCLEHLFPKNFVAVVEIDNQPFFAISWENGDPLGVDGIINKYGQWYVYRYQDNSLHLETTVSYTQEINTLNNKIQYERSYSIFNGIIKGYEEYENWTTRIGIFTALDSDGEWLSNEAFDLTDPGEVAEVLDKYNTWIYKAYSTQFAQTLIDLYYSLSNFWQLIFLLSVLCVIIVPVIMIFRAIHSILGRNERKKYSQYNKYCLEIIQNTQQNISIMYHYKPLILEKRPRRNIRVILMTMMLFFIFCVAEVAPRIVSDMTIWSTIMDSFIYSFLESVTALLIWALVIAVIVAVYYFYSKMTMKRRINIRVTKNQKGGKLRD